MTATLAVHRNFAEVLAQYGDAGVIGVDMLIGLGGCEPRACDVLARRELGRRASSVFPAPDRRLLAFTGYAQALAESRRLCGKGISKQSFYLFPKIREIDQLMTPQLQRRVIEVHPELCFTMLAGKPAVHRKSTPEGFEERKQLLPITWREEKLAAKPDDLLDALAVAWVAHEFAHGRSLRFPDPPAFDPRGLRMEIVTCSRRAG